MFIFFFPFFSFPCTIYVNDCELLPKWRNEKVICYAKMYHKNKTLLLLIVIQLKQ